MGMGQTGKGSMYSGPGKDSVKDPGSSASGGFNPVKNPSMPVEMEGLDLIENPGGPNGEKKQPSNAGMGAFANKESVPEGGPLPLPDVDKHLITGGQSAPGGTIPSQKMPPVPVQTSAAPASGGGHRPFKLR